MEPDDPTPDGVEEREYAWMADVLRSLDPSTRRRFIQRLAGAGASMIFASSVPEGAFAQSEPAEQAPARAMAASRAFPGRAYQPMVQQGALRQGEVVGAPVADPPV